MQCKIPFVKFQSLSYYMGIVTEIPTDISFVPVGIVSIGICSSTNY